MLSAVGVDAAIVATAVLRSVWREGVDICAVGGETGEGENAVEA